MKIRKVLYPGSFDPITVGHIDIIHRLSPLFDEIVLLVSHSVKKSHLFTAGERKSLAEAALKDVKNVTVDVFDGLTVEYAKKHAIPVMVRGLRAISDYEQEFAMASMNKKLWDGVETLIIFARPEFNYISSRTVKEIVFHGGSVKGLVHEIVERALAERVEFLRKSGSAASGLKLE